jgi:hypothetical protein
MCADGVISIDSTLYAINPMMSSAPPEFANRRPGILGSEEIDSGGERCRKEAGCQATAKTQ